MPGIRSLLGDPVIGSGAFTLIIPPQVLLGVTKPIFSPHHFFDSPSVLVLLGASIPTPHPGPIKPGGRFDRDPCTHTLRW